MDLQQRLIQKIPGVMDDYTLINCQRIRNSTKINQQLELLIGSQNPLTIRQKPPMKTQKLVCNHMEEFLLLKTLIIPTKKSMTASHPWSLIHLERSQLFPKTSQPLSNPPLPNLNLVSEAFKLFEQWMLVRH